MRLCSVIYWSVCIGDARINMVSEEFFHIFRRDSKAYGVNLQLPEHRVMFHQVRFLSIEFWKSELKKFLGIIAK